MSSYSSLLVDIGGTNMRYAYANKRNISEEKILSNISDQKINKTLGNLLSNPQIKNAVIAGRQCFLSGKMKKKQFATATSPTSKIFS